MVGSFSVFGFICGFSVTAIRLVDRKLKDQIEGEVKRRESTIRSTAQDYNKLCDQLSVFIAAGNAPVNAVAPLKMDFTRALTSSSVKASAQCSSTLGIPCPSKAECS